MGEQARHFVCKLRRPQLFLFRFNSLAVDLLKILQVPICCVLLLFDKAARSHYMMLTQDFFILHEFYSNKH